VPRPVDFPIGSPESRAAARAEVERRIRCEDETATVMISTGLPHYGLGPPVVEPPDSIAHYSMPDESIVEVIRRHWEGATDRGVTIYVGQVWPDGNTYHGSCRVNGLSDIETLGGRLQT